VMSLAAVNDDAPEPSPDVSARRPHVADQLQARLFDEILQCELDELESLPRRIPARTSDRGDLRLHKDLQPLNARVNEVRQLLSALRERFSAM
jgi:Ser/Thr protein kinase RdoA (MazF antagonist)